MDNRMTQHDIDVSNLPTIAFGSRSPLWWAEMLTIMMLSAIVATLIATYLYLRIGFASWPGPDATPPSLLLPTICFVVLLIVAAPIYSASNAAQRGERRRTTYGLAITFLLAIIFLVLRFSAFNELGVKWYSTVYGSLVWVIMGFHTILTIAATVWTGILLGITLGQKDREQQEMGIEINALYWGFLALSWIPFYVLLFVYPAALMV
jgi:heme/copper-type cytochrome/quinol oxidase subunit 3